MPKQRCLHVLAQLLFCMGDGHVHTIGELLRGLHRQAFFMVLQRAARLLQLSQHGILQAGTQIIEFLVLFFQTFARMFESCLPLL